MLDTHNAPWTRHISVNKSRMQESKLSKESIIILTVLAVVFGLLLLSMSSIIVAKMECDNVAKLSGGEVMFRGDNCYIKSGNRWVAVSSKKKKPDERS